MSILSLLECSAYAIRLWERLLRPGLICARGSGSMTMLSGSLSEAATLEKRIG
jgi:hypothetical protein